MDKYTALGIGIGVATVGAVGYILYKQYKQNATTIIIPPTTTTTTQTTPPPTTTTTTQTTPPPTTTTTTQTTPPPTTTTTTQTTQTSNTQSSTQQGVSVDIYNACYENMTLKITSPNGGQQNVQIIPGMHITMQVPPGSTISATDNNGNQVLSPYTIPNQSGINITIATCPSNLKTVEIIGQKFSVVRQGNTVIINSAGQGRSVYRAE